MIQMAGILYLIAIVGVIIFQVCLIAGAPWGRLTQGGQYVGVLPPSSRVAAGLSVLILACMAAGIASAADMAPHWPRLSAYVALGLQVVSTIVNWITPSRAERRLWGPINTAMLGLAAFILFGQ